MKTKHANEIYLLKRKQRIEKLEKEIQQDIERTTREVRRIGGREEDIWKRLDKTRIEKYIDIICDTPITFPIGKYKGRIVQDIMEENIEYCEWYVNNIRGYSIEELRLSHYLHFKVMGRKYRIARVDVEGINALIKILPVNIVTALTNRASIREPLILDYIKEISTYPEYRKNSVYGKYAGEVFDIVSPEPDDMDCLSIGICYEDTF